MSTWMDQLNALGKQLDALAEDLDEEDEEEEVWCEDRTGQVMTCPTRLAAKGATCELLYVCASVASASTGKSLQVRVLPGPSGCGRRGAAPRRSWT